ncbi:hypothetical protein BV20DRAFT_786915 [Pilatotrama ljubarskyi]|nr:hypothetical protein BV20DRAFT_786915 [Pilatotrama ljubarskyi]
MFGDTDEPVCQARAPDVSRCSDGTGFQVNNLPPFQVCVRRNVRTAPCSLHWRCAEVAEPSTVIEEDLEAQACVCARAPHLPRAYSNRTICVTRFSAETGCAADPFKRKYADVLLRTSDDVEFRVHKNVVALASPALASFIALAPRVQSTSSTSSRSHHMAHCQPARDEGGTRPFLAECRADAHPRQHRYIAGARAEARCALSDRAHKSTPSAPRPPRGRPHGWGGVRPCELCRDERRRPHRGAPYALPHASCSTR